jgi:hypothetical protein
MEIMGEEKKNYVPGLDKDLFSPIRRTSRRCRTDVGGELFEGVVWAYRESVECARGVHVLAASEHLWVGKHGVVVCRGRAEIHGDVFSLARGGVDALCVPRVGRGGHASPDVSLAIVALECGVGEVVVRRGITWSGEDVVVGIGGGERGVGRMAGVITLVRSGCGEEGRTIE